MKYKPALLSLIAALLLFNVLSVESGSVRAEESSRIFQYDQIPSLKGVVPRQTEYYTILPTVTTDGPYYTFQITTDHGNYTVVGITRLVKVTHEIVMIELFRRTDQGSEVWTGAKDSVKGIGKGAKQIVLHPGDSGKAIGRKAKQVGRSVKRFFKDKFGKDQEERESSTGEELDKGVGGFFTNEQARVFAYQNDLDIYSSNPYVRALIGEVSKSRWKGSLGVSAALFFVSPIPGLSAVTNGALTSSERNEQMEILLRDNEPADLRRALGIQYREAFGVARNSPEEAVFMRFVENPNFSPREAAYVFSAMKVMRGVDGHQQLVQMLADIETVEAAQFVYNQLELLAALHTSGKTLGQYAINGSRVSGILTSGDAVTIWPIDYATANTSLLEQTRLIARGANGKSTNLWIIGDAMPSFRDAMKQQGIYLQEAILQYPAFRNAADGKPQPAAQPTQPTQPIQQPAPSGAGTTGDGNIYKPN